MDDCLICKKHYTQGGKCMENKRNCLWYENEPRGKMIRTNVTVDIDVLPETPILRFGEKLLFEDFEAICIKINWVNLETRGCNIEIDYHEKEKPRFERIKMFRIIK